MCNPFPPATPYHYITQVYLLKFFIEPTISTLQPKIIRHTKKQKTQFKEIEHIRTIVNTVTMLNLVNKEFLNTISVLRALMGKVDNMQELMNNGSREMAILRKNEKEMLQI